MMILFVCIFGLLIGSFLNVCIYRIPLGKSIFYPPSACCHCGIRLRFFDLVPVISFLFLKGKCRYCQQRISWRYPLLELLSGMVFVLIFLVMGFNSTLVPYYFLASLLIIVSFIDIDHYRIPDSIMITGFISGLIFLIIISFTTFINAFWGFLIGGGFLFLTAVFSRGGMGCGDIKLGAVIGLFLGGERMVLTLFLASLLASVIGVGLIILKKKNRKDYLPFGPFLAAGALVSLLFGNRLVGVYIDYFFL